MEVTVTGRKMSVSDTLRAYVEEKIGNAVRVFKISPMSAEVVLRKETNPANPRSAVAEVTLFTKGHIIRTEEAEEDIYAAIDVAAAKVERQLRKYKTRVIDKRQQSRNLQEALKEGLSGDVLSLLEEPSLEFDERILEFGDERQIVRVKEISLSALTEEEALIQIDLLGHDFFMYMDSVTGLVNVMYRRKDGSYGILKPRLERIDD